MRKILFALIGCFAVFCAHAAQFRMFFRTFYNCTSLTGPSARINGQYLYEIWPSATSDQVDDTYYKATGLSDYAKIPSRWK